MAKSVMQLSINIDKDYLEPGVLKILAIVRPEWKQDLINLKTLPGGFINTMMSCHHKNDEQNLEAVVVRVFGEQGTSNRENEILGLQILESLGCGAECLAIFDNGIVFNYLRGRLMTVKDYSNDVMMKTCLKGLAKLHTMNLDTVHLVDKEGKLAKLDTKYTVFEKQLSQLLSVIPEKLKDGSRQEKYEQEFPSKDELKEEVEYIVEYLREIGLPTCVCHNDFSDRNTIFNQETGAVYFVDCEFFGYNYEARELCFPFLPRQWLKHIGICAPEDRLPDEDKRKLWIRWYLEAKYEYLGKDSHSIKQFELEKMYLENSIFQLLYTFWIFLISLSLAEDEKILAMGFDVCQSCIILRDSYYPMKRQLEENKHIYINKYKST